MRILNILFLFLSLNLAAQEELSKDEISQFQKEMLTKTKDLLTLEADFIQTKKIAMITDESVSRGKIYYQNPEKLKWEYAEPKDYVILFIEEELHIDDAGDKSVRNTSSNKLFDKIAKLITGSVNGKLLQDNENFDISYTRNNNLISALIIPKDKNLKAMFAEIHLSFNKENIVEQVDLKEEAGDMTTIEFSKIKINHEIPPTVFEP
ncbi:LolA family protein [Salegentibacter salegens]|uniref:Outer membrane lipoprotein carrier protein n=1 Tax=Salegentibacter salegens TaxID=143223 RepID=A0A1M7J2A7_9FLAO|nr:outer membrane lipoprotein carrier protein LolA [Salegentibacter salegens]PRX47389.1 outer membrane lipoprotein carrier protein [Salegentibacter salegens]SHM47078.1 outer membrane lipoprotein carrier protein [Salegentibacter salegens]